MIIADIGAAVTGLENEIAADMNDFPGSARTRSRSSMNVGWRSG